MPLTAETDLLAGQIDLPRMRADRFARLQAEMGRSGLPAMLVFGSGAVQYTAGPSVVASDAGRAAHRRTSVLVLLGEQEPHLFTPYPEGAPPELTADHLHPPWYTESDQGVEAMAARLSELAGGTPDRLAVDDLSGPFFRLAPQLLKGTELIEAAKVLGPARLIKTADELGCIRRAQHINEMAMDEVRAKLRPGVRQSELTGTFLRRAFELGATSNGIDPIFQPMAPRRSDGPFTTNGDVAFPLTTTDRILADGEVIWVDSGIHYHGYASDYGRTWIVAERPVPTPRQRDHFRRWREVAETTLSKVRPGATGADLTAAARSAAGAGTPWLAHFYLIHGVGTESAEAPMFGTDMGTDHDAGIVLEAGMVLVLEPVIWDDGYGGYRSEDIVAVTADGWAALSDSSYEPFDR